MKVRLPLNGFYLCPKHCIFSVYKILLLIEWLLCYPETAVGADEGGPGLRSGGEPRQMQIQGPLPM